MFAIFTAGAVASAQSTSGIEVTPTTVQTAAQFSTTAAHAYEGDAGTLTVTIPANSILEAGTPLSFEECNLDPTSQSSCDGLTIQLSSVGQTSQVIPAANGSVTFTMLLWILPTGNPSTTPDVGDPTNNNPSGFDSGSTVTCDASDPCAIWVGDSTSSWSSNSYVFDTITPLPGSSTLPTTTTTTPSTTTTTTASTTSTTTASTTSTTVPSTTSTTTASTTSTTSPSGGQVPESPYVPLLPIAAGGVAGAGFILYLVRRRKAA